MKLRVLLNGIEERDDVIDDEVYGRNIGADAVRSAMTFNVESKASETHLSEKDGSGLESPADVIAVAMDHEDETTWRRRARGKP